MTVEVDEGTLAAQVMALDIIDPAAVWARVQRSQSRREAPKQGRLFRLPWTRRVALALVAATALTLLGGTAIAISLWTRPANVHGKAISGAPDSSSPQMTWPGHPIQTSLEEAGRLAGFRVLTLASGGELNSVTYVPEVVRAGQRTPATGGAAILDYSIDGTEVQISEARDPNPSSPLDINQKIPPGSAAALCSTVETIGGGQYIFVRCPDGTTINTVLWKTLDGIDIALVAVPPSSAGDKSKPAPGLSVSIVEFVIEHLH